MYILDIISSPDSNIIGEYETWKKHLIIGKSLKADFPIDDLEIEDIHCLIGQTDSELYIKSTQNTGHYILNDKKFFGRSTLKKDDQIKIGETLFKVVNVIIDSTEENSDFQSIYSKNIKEYPELSGLLDVLEKEIIRVGNE